MSYVQATLIKGEKIKAKAKLHWINYLITMLMACVSIIFFIFWIIGLFDKDSLFFSVLLLICVLSTLCKYLDLKLMEMVVTNKRVVCRTGIISVRTEELKNQKIESVEIKQSLLGRIFGYADIWFSGTGTSKVVFKSIASPWKLKAKFEEIVGD